MLRQTLILRPTLVGVSNCFRALYANMPKDLIYVDKRAAEAKAEADARADAAAKAEAAGNPQTYFGE
jgi:hypothetical protein